MRDEAKLVEKVLDGDESAFEILLHPYRKGILNMAYQICLNPEDARDVFQDAVIKTYQYLKKFKKTKSFKNWVYKITTHAAYDFLRKKNREQNLIKDQEKISTNTGCSPEKQYHNREIKDKIEFCLRFLTPKEKTVYVLRDVREFSIKETSQILKISSQSVRTHLSRARRKIRLQFEKSNQKKGEINEV